MILINMSSKAMNNILKWSRNETGFIKVLTILPSKILLFQDWHNGKKIIHSWIHSSSGTSQVLRGSMK